jgi:hypothetical protein
MHPEDLKVDQKSPLEFQDQGGCSMGWMRGFPHDAYTYSGDASGLTPQAFEKAEGLGGSYSGMGYRKAWLASIKVPSQSKMRALLQAAGYVLLATSAAAHDPNEKMELWGKGFTIPVQENKPAQRLRARAHLVCRPHKRAAQAA